MSGPDLQVVKRLMTSGASDKEVQNYLDGYVTRESRVSHVTGPDVTRESRIKELARARQAKKRAKDREALSRVTSRDEPGTPYIREDIDLREEALEERKIEKKKKKDIRRKTQISEDWWPSEIAFAKVKQKNGCTQEEANREAEQMVNHHMAKGTTSTNWDLNFYLWMNNWEKWRGDGKATAGIQRSNGKQSIHDAARDLYRAAVLEEECGGSDSVAGWGLPRLREG